MQDPGGCWQTEAWDTLVRLRAQVALLTWLTVLDGVSSLHQKSYEQTKVILQLACECKKACLQVSRRTAWINVMLLRDLDTATEASAAWNRFFKLLMIETRCGPQRHRFGFVKLHNTRLSCS